jgi:two-component system response regulator MprA
VGSPADAIALLEAGADDVAMEEAPFEVVAALLNAALRRARVINEQLRIKFGDIVYDREARRVWCAGREVAFTPRELRLFDILFQRAGNPVSADTLQDFVWNDGPPTKSNSLAVYIGYLRRKLKGSRISMLETLRGSGYRLARRD